MHARQRSTQTRLRAPGARRSRPRAGFAGPERVAASLTLTPTPRTALAVPVTLSPDAFGATGRVRDAYVAWLDRDWEKVGSMLDFALEVGLIEGAEIEAALSELEIDGHAEPLYRLTENAQGLLGSRLSERAERLGCDEAHPVFSVGSVDVYGAPGIAIEGSVMISSAIPCSRLRPDVVRLCLLACGVMDRSLGASTRVLWDIDGGQDFYLIERMIAFDEMTVEMKSDAALFLDACMRLAQSDGVFEDVTTLEDAEAVLEWFERAQHARTWMEACRKADTSGITEQEAEALAVSASQSWNAWNTLTAEALEEDALALCATLPAESEDRAWLDWVRDVARVCADRPEISQELMVEADETWPAQYLIQIDPELPWWEGCAESTWEHAMNAGEPFVSIWEWAPGRGRHILQALEGIVDAAALVWCAPPTNDNTPDKAEA